jgi:hypothetical protein
LEILPQIVSLHSWTWDVILLFVINLLNRVIAMSGIHRASSKSWGDQSIARVCQIIVDSNDGMAQQVIENRTDLLDIIKTEDLLRVDDLGLSLPYICIYHDRPKMLEYLHRRGVDLGATCDPCDYGTPMYYAITLLRHQCVIMLDLLGYSIHTPCTKYEELPVTCAERLDDRMIMQTIEYVKEKEFRAVTLFLKNYWKSRLRRDFVAKRTAIKVVQRIVRQFLAKRKLRRRKQRAEKRLLEEKIKKQAGFAGGGSKRGINR